MEIFMYDVKKQESIQIPVIPQSIEVQSPQKIESFETLGQGDLKLIGVKGNRTLTLSSFFPVNDYPFAKITNMKGMQYVEKIESWRAQRNPLNILITNLNINFKCVVDSFSYSIQDGSGDIYYNINIEEFKTPVFKKITPDKKKITTSPSKTVTPLASTYGIVTAKDGLNVRSGNGTNYPIIGTLAYNQKVKLFRLEDSGKWWHIYYGNHGGRVSSEWIRRV